MNLRRMYALMVKEWIHIIRDWRSLVITIITPILLVGLFGYALTLDVDHIPLIVWDQSKTPVSRDFISHFNGSSYFNIAKQDASGYGDIQQAIDSRRALGGIIIPENFDRSIFQNEWPSVQLIVDGSDANTTTIALGYADALTQKYWNHHLEASTPKGIASTPGVIPITHIWYNPNLDSHFTIIPGLIAVIMMVVSTLMTALAVSREWEQRTMFQLLSTPMQPSEFILGKLLPYFTLAMLDVILIMVVGHYLFGVPIYGNLLLVLFTAAIFCMGSLCLGLLISSFARNQLLATQLAMLLTFIPSFLLSGFFTPIDSMPYPIQLLTYFVPARYFVTSIRAIFLKGVGIEALYTEVLILCLFTLALLLLTVRTIQKRRIS